MSELDRRYLERRPKRGKIGWVWNNRHAKKHGIKSEWLGYDESTATQRAHQLNKMYDAACAGQKALHPEGSLGWWTKQIEGTKKHADRPKSQRNEVENNFKRLRETPLATKQLTVIKGSHIETVHEKLTASIGLSLASKTMKWLRYSLHLAIQEKLLTASPMEGLRIKQPLPRQVVVFEDEVNRLEEYFIAAGRLSLALGIRFAYDTGQRTADIIRFPWSRWSLGDVLIPQGKTKAVVRVRALPELVAAISRAESDSKARQQKGTIVMVNEETGKPWTGSNFSHRINDGFRELGLTDEETGKAKVYRDLRRSAVVRLGQAGCTAFEIGSVTGHSYTRIEQILETYLPRSTPMARAAIERLLQSRQKLG